MGRPTVSLRAYYFRYPLGRGMPVLICRPTRDMKRLIKPRCTAGLPKTATGCTLGRQRSRQNRWQDVSVSARRRVSVVVSVVSTCRWFDWACLSDRSWLCHGGQVDLSDSELIAAYQKTLVARLKHFTAAKVAKTTPMPPPSAL